MRVKACPVPELLSASLDGELEFSANEEICAHVSACPSCLSTLARLREVDAVFRQQPAIRFRSVRSVAPPAQRRLPRRAVTVILSLLAVTSAALGGRLIGIELAQVFQTDGHVKTVPVERFPADLFDEMKQGSAAHTAIPTGNEVSIRPTEEIEASMGTRLLTPSFVPEGYELIQAFSPFPLHAELVYLKPGSPTLNIRQSNQLYGLQETPPIHLTAGESVDVDGKKGIYVRGGWSQETENDIPKWDSDLVHSVVFDEGPLVVEISASTVLDREELLRVASSMR